jgi:hypothetical protein
MNVRASLIRPARVVLGMVSVACLGGCGCWSAEWCSSSYHGSYSSCGGQGCDAAGAIIILGAVAIAWGIEAIAQAVRGCGH